MTYVIMMLLEKGSREIPITSTEDRDVMIELLKTHKGHIRAYYVPTFPNVSNWYQVGPEDCE